MLYQSQAGKSTTSYGLIRKKKNLFKGILWFVGYNSPGPLERNLVKRKKIVRAQSSGNRKVKPFWSQC